MQPAQSVLPRIRLPVSEIAACRKKTVKEEKGCASVLFIGRLLPVASSAVPTDIAADGLNPILGGGLGREGRAAAPRRRDLMQAACVAEGNAPYLTNLNYGRPTGVTPHSLWK